MTPGAQTQTTAGLRSGPGHHPTHRLQGPTCGVHCWSRQNPQSLSKTAGNAWSGAPRTRAFSSLYSVVWPATASESEPTELHFQVPEQESTGHSGKSKSKATSYWVSGCRPPCWVCCHFWKHLPARSQELPLSQGFRCVCRPCVPSKDRVTQHGQLGLRGPEPAQCWAASVHRRLGSWFGALTSRWGHRRRPKASVRAKLGGTDRLPPRPALP